MSSADHRLGSFLRLLDLEETSTDVFRAPVPSDWPGRRLFGGQVAAQALRAAAATVDADRSVHSMHAYFIRPGRTDTPVELRVERTRDGRSFTTRRVAVVQRDETIFDMVASFHRTEEGATFQLPVPSDVPPPEDAPEPGHRWGSDALLPLERREPPTIRTPEGGWARRSWMRVTEPLPDDPVLHDCILAFCSDMGMVGAVRAALDVDRERVMGASLDHAVWFHRRIRTDEWFLYDRRPVSASNARGLAQATIHTRDGVLAATVSQEALVRIRDH